MHVRYGTTDKDWVIMDSITKKSIPFINMGLMLLCNQRNNVFMHGSLDFLYAHLTELYRCNTFTSIGFISIYSTCCHKANSEAYLVCSDARLGKMYMIGKYKDIMIAYQTLMVICAIAPTELLNKKLKEERDEKNKLSIGHRKGTYRHTKDW